MMTKYVITTPVLNSNIEEISTNIAQIIGVVLAILLAIGFICGVVYFAITCIVSTEKENKLKQEFEKQLLKEKRDEEYKIIQEYKNLKVSVINPWKKNKKINH